MLYRFTIIFMITLLGISCQPQKSSILFLNVQEKEQDLILSEFPWENIPVVFDSRKELLTYLEEGNPADVLFYNDAGALNNLSPYLNSLEEINVNLMPRSMQALGVRGNRRLAIPLQLDHVELALEKERFGNLLAADGESFSLAQLEEALAAESTSQFVPLVLAGGEDSDLLDLLFLLQTTLGGGASLSALCREIESGKNLNQLLLEKDSGKTLQESLDLLVRWRSRGILHPEWYRFSYKDRTFFVEEKLCGAMIIPLSEHRKMPLELINAFEALPFPDNAQQGLAVDIYAPPLLVSVLQNSSLKEETAIILSTMIQEDFQKKICFPSGLAPVNSTVETLDKQASDLRFYAAASRSIAVESPLLEAGSPYSSFLQEIRNYLISRKS